MIARPAVLVAMALSSLVAGKADANYFDGNELLAWCENWQREPIFGKETKLRADGVTQAEIDAMLDDFEEIYAHDDDAERKLVVAALRKAARPIQ